MRPDQNNAAMQSKDRTKHSHSHKASVDKTHLRQKLRWIKAKVAQLVERNLAKVKVAGSRPVFRSQSIGLYDPKKPFPKERVF